MSAELPPEAQAVIDAALAFRAAPLARDVDELNDLCRAVDAYRKASAPPEPFEAFMSYHRDATNPYPSAAYVDTSLFDNMRHGELWRCTVTPIERVR